MAEEKVMGPRNRRGMQAQTEPSMSWSPASATRARSSESEQRELSSPQVCRRRRSLGWALAFVGRRLCATFGSKLDILIVNDRSQGCLAEERLPARTVDTKLNAASHNQLEPEVTILAFGPQQNHDTVVVARDALQQEGVTKAVADRHDLVRDANAGQAAW